MVKINGHILVAPVDQTANIDITDRNEKKRKMREKIKGGYNDRRNGAETPEIVLMKIVNNRPDIQKLLENSPDEKWCQFVEDYKKRGLEYAIKEFDPNSDDYTNEW